MTGMRPGSGWVDVGATNLPFADDAPDLPLFKITCRPDAPAHPYLGRVIYTQDPGRALISGRCMDVGAIVVGQLRGLSSRAPYFSNGSAASLREVVDFYDRRFNIRFSEAEKQDLVNFLSVL
jgi:cytochrome c peroxidase